MNDGMSKSADVALSSRMPAVARNLLTKALTPQKTWAKVGALYRCAGSLLWVLHLFVGEVKTEAILIKFSPYWPAR